MSASRSAIWHACAHGHAHPYEQLETRRIILRWRTFVQSTYRDAYTLEILDKMLRTHCYFGMAFWELQEDDLAQRC